ncbi:MAG TPA: hypothetical protein VK558_02965 [Patescibacteria group bacterium]|nr:hypothetical protein [Patescibacteria group bacterium]
MVRRLLPPGCLAAMIAQSAAVGSFQLRPLPVILDGWRGAAYVTQLTHYA